MYHTMDNRSSRAEILDLRFCGAGGWSDSVVAKRFSRINIPSCSFPVLVFNCWNTLSNYFILFFLLCYTDFTDTCCFRFNLCNMEVNPATGGHKPVKS